MALLFRTSVSLENDLTLTIRRLPIISPFPERRIVKLLYLLDFRMDITLG